jgi:hypothetical protein
MNDRLSYGSGDSEFVRGAWIAVMPPRGRVPLGLRPLDRRRHPALRCGMASRSLATQI